MLALVAQRRTALDRAERTAADFGVELGRAGLAGDDIDHAANGVAAIQRGQRAFDHFDALDDFRADIGQRRGAERAVIEAHAIEQHQGVGAVAAAGEQRGRLAGTAAAADVEAGVLLQDLRDVGGLHPLDLRAVDDDGLRQRVGLRHRRARFGDDHRLQRRINGGGSNRIGSKSEGGRERQPDYGEGFHDGSGGLRPRRPNGEYIQPGHTVIPLPRLTPSPGRSPDSWVIEALYSKASLHRGAFPDCSSGFLPRLPIYRCGGSAGMGSGGPLSVPASRLIPGVWRREHLRGRHCRRAVAGLRSSKRDEAVSLSSPGPRQKGP